MSIKEILEKYREANGLIGIHPASMELLHAELEQEMFGFAQWAADHYYYAGKDKWIDQPGSTHEGLTTSELYALFLTNKNKTDE